MHKNTQTDKKDIYDFFYAIAPNVRSSELTACAKGNFATIYLYNENHKLHNTFDI